MGRTSISWPKFTPWRNWLTKLAAIVILSVCLLMLLPSGHESLPQWRISAYTKTSCTMTGTITSAAILFVRNAIWTSGETNGVVECEEAKAKTRSEAPSFSPSVPYCVDGSEQYSEGARKHFGGKVYGVCAGHLGRNCTGYARHLQKEIKHFLLFTD